MKRLSLRSCLLALVLGLTGGMTNAEGQRLELRKLQGYVAEIRQQLAQLQAALREAEERNRTQSRMIGQLESELEVRQASRPDAQTRLRQDFFAGLAGRLPRSPIYRIEDDRVLIAVDPVFVFSTARLGAEGEARLQALSSAVHEQMQTLPESVDWRLRVEGHTDSRALRSNSRFADNWELSAARATQMVRYLIRQGMREGRLEAVALAATEPRDRSDAAAEHRRNRRIELHLEFFR